MQRMLSRHSESAHAVVHSKIGTRTRRVSAGFRTAFVGRRTIVAIAEELAHHKESGSSSASEQCSARA